MHDPTLRNNGANTERNPLSQDMKIVGVTVTAQKCKTVPKIEPERLAIKNGQKRRPGVISVHM